MNIFEQGPVKASGVDIATESAHGDARQMAQNIIMHQLQQAHAMGANDKEPALIRELVEKMNRGEVDPEVAVAKAREIFGNKEDYH